MFEKCINCERLGKDCFPNFFIMPVNEMRDWASKLKDYKRISNAELSHRSGIPKGTIDMHFKKKTPYSSDVNYSTFAPIICALMGCDYKEMECPPTVEQHAEERDILIREYEKKVEYLKNQIAEEHRISERRVKVMYFLGIVLFALLLLIIFAFAVDALDYSRGFLWTNKT